MTSSESILLRLGFDASAVKSGTSAMMASQRAAGGEIKQMWSNIGSSIGGLIGFGALVASLHNIAGRVKEINAGSAKTGLDTDTFQRMSQVANEELPDGAAKFDTAITRLNVNIGLGAKNFEKWGIHSRNASEAVYEIADRMQSMTDPAQRAAMAVELMGRNGAQLVPLLERGAAALKEMGAGKTIFSAKDLKDISDANRQVEEATSRLTIWGGKFIGVIAEAARALGHISAGDIGLGTDYVAQAAQKKVFDEAQRKRVAAMDAADPYVSELGKGAADEEERAAKAADYAERSAEGKAAAEKETTEELKKQEKLNKLYGDAAKIRIEASKVEKEVPTIEMLAGRGYMGRLNSAYGAGGQFDLEAGNGPGAQLAQEYELTKKQQMWDMVHGNFGQAERDRKKQIGLANQLGAFGMDTPAMKFDAMKEHLNKIQTDISAIANGSTLNVAVSDAPAEAKAAPTK
jgi:hypothetical protein